MAPLCRYGKEVLSVVAVLLALALVSCGSGGSGGSPSPGGETGSVAFLLTDAATDEFSEVNVTIERAELLSDSFKVAIFTGPKTVDLLKLEDETSLFSLSSGVPSGWYEKIRLHVSAIVLVRGDGTKVYPKLPGGWKIDLNPRKRFHVAPGGVLVMQLDLDANKSIHLVRTGAGDKYIFRPVVFVDILDRLEKGRLLSLFGRVGSIDAPGTTFELCPPKTFYKAGYGDGNVQEDVTECVDVHADAQTSFFDADGNPAGFGDIRMNDLLTAVGHIRIGTSSWKGGGAGRLGLDAAVVEWGRFLRPAGLIKTLPDPLRRFEFELFPGQGFATGTVLTAELQNGTRFFSWKGGELGEADMVLGMKARIDGVLVVSETGIFRTALVVLKTGPHAALDKIDGIVRNLNARTFDLYDPTDSTTECVEVQDGARVFLIRVTEGSYESEETGLNGLGNGQEVEVYGAFGSGSCFTADTILASPL